MVYALALDGDGNLYAGGSFHTAGRVSANHVAKWNGTAWSPLGSGTSDWVYALAVDDAGNVYAGGSFDSAGGVSANLIAKWDGAVWSPLGSGMAGEDLPGVSALAVDNPGHAVYALSLIHI